MTGQEARDELRDLPIVNIHEADEGVIQVGGLRFHNDGTIEGMPEDAPEAARIFAAELLKARTVRVTLAPAGSVGARDDEREALIDAVVHELRESGEVIKINDDEAWMGDPLDRPTPTEFVPLGDIADRLRNALAAAGYRKHPEPEITDDEKEQEMTTGVDLIAAERARQVREEGYTPQHDRGHAPEMIRAAKEYAEEAHFQAVYGPVEVKPGQPRRDVDSGMTNWPWHPSFWKPTGDPVRDLVKAGALIAAAIDSLQAER